MNVEKQMLGGISPQSVQEQPRSPLYIDARARLVTAPSGSTGKAKHGGHRNTRERSSDSLTTKQVASLKEAFDHSWVIGLPLTRFITIHLEGQGIDASQQSAAITQILDRLRKHTVRNRGRFAAVWVRESGDGKGDHVHIVAHIPNELVPRLAPLLRKWIKTISGQPYRKDTINSRPIGLRLGIEKSFPQVHRINLMRVQGYLLKGASPEAAATHGLTRREPGGWIIGKRCGFTANLGKQAKA